MSDFKREVAKNPEYGDAVRKIESDERRRKEAESRYQEEEQDRIGKYMKMPQLLGEDNILRMKKHKAELDELRLQIEKQEKQKAML